VSRLSARQLWLDHPEQVPLRQVLFQLHLWLGALLAAWMLIMSISGSVLVFRDQFERYFSISWLLRLHTTLLAGSRGQLVNAGGAFVLLVLCATGAVIWWPGRAHWRRSHLTIDWRGSLPRITWDAHAALGFWFFGFVFLWGLSGLYLSQFRLFDLLYRLDPNDRLADRVLFALAELHFGRFNIFTKIIWSGVGLVPAVLAITGFFICCRRVIFHKSSNPKRVPAASLAGN
jgi:uncharacterized iron-regulated membrane protein